MRQIKRNKKLYKIVGMLIVLFLSFPLIIQGAQPTPQSGTGTGTYTGYSAYYKTIGYSLMFGGYTTSVSLGDSALKVSEESTTQRFNEGFRVVELSGKERRARGSILVFTASGAYRWYNYEIVINPPNFNPDSLSKGRSLLDNLFLESGVNKSDLKNKLVNGGQGWVNAIVSGRTQCCHNHASMSNGKLWSNGSANYTYATRVYSTDRIRDAFYWTSYTKTTLARYYDNEFTFPAIPEMDDTPPVHISHSITDQQYRNGNDYWIAPGRNLNIRLRGYDADTGLKDTRLSIGGGSARAIGIHDWNGGSTNLNNTHTFSAFTINSVSRTYQSGGTKEATFNVKGNTHGANYIVRHYYRDNAGNIQTGGDAAGWSYSIGNLRVDGVAPTHSWDAIQNARYVNGSTYWVQPNDSVTIKLRQYDPHSGNKFQYLRLYGNSQDSRTQHVFADPWNNNNHWMTSSHVSIDSAARESISGNPQYQQVAYGVTPKTHGHIYDVMYYYRDNVHNKFLDYVSTGKKLAVDGVAPTHVSQQINGARYVNGNDYWIRSNDTINIIYRQRDVDSGNKQQYIRFLDSGSIVARSEHNFNSSATNNTRQVTSSSVDISSANRTENTTYGTVDWTVSASGNGKSFQFQRYYRDNVVNFLGYVTTGNLRVDDVAPTVSLSQSPTSWTNGNVIVTASIADSGSGVSHKRYASGTRTVSYFNNGSSGTALLTGDKFTATSNGTWIVYARDNVGNQTVRTISVTNIDKIAPTVSLSQSPTTWTNGNVVVTASIADSGGSNLSHKRYASGTQSIAYFSNGTGGTALPLDDKFTVTSNGTWTVYARDNAGNQTVKTISITNIDKIAPTISLSQSPTAWTNGNVVVTASIADSGGSNLSHKRYASGTQSIAYFSNGTGLPLDDKFTVTSNGTWTVYARDNAGNQTVKTISITNIDKIAPTISLSQSPTAWTNGNVVVTASIADSGGSNISHKRYASGAQSIAYFSNGTGGTALPLDDKFTVTSNGTWTVYARDNAGNQIVKTISVTNIDKTPATHVSHEIEGHRFQNGNDYWIRPNDTVDIRLRAKDEDSGIWLHYLRLTGNDQDARSQHNWDSEENHNNHWMTSDHVSIDSAARTFDNSIEREVTWGVTSQTHDHVYAVQYYYRDYAGNNVGYNNTGMFLKIDGVAPDVTFNPNSSDWTNEDINVGISISDSHSGLSEWRYRVENNGVWSSWSSWNTSSSLSVLLSDRGTKRIQVEAIDNVGNSVTSTSGNYLLNSPPISNFTESPNPTTRLQSVQFINTSSDAENHNLSYVWQQRIKGTTTWSTFSTATNPTFTFTTVNTYEVRLTVTDNHEASHSIIREVMVNNLAPVANFSFEKSPYYIGDHVNVYSTSTDPESDSLTFRYDVINPNGQTITYNDGDISFSASELGYYTVKHIVTDSFGASSQKTVLLLIRDLDITAYVEHTENWELIHDDLGSLVGQFFSGEKFVVHADVTDYPIDYVTVSFSGMQVNNEYLYLDQLLTNYHPRYSGVVYDPAMSEPTTKLAHETVYFLFTAKWSNGTIKTDLVSVKIIGDVFSAYNFYRSN